MKDKDPTVAIKPWYSFKGGKFEGDLPAFFDHTAWSWLDDGKKLFPEIRREIETLLSQKSDVLEPYFNSALVNAGGKWDVVNFRFWGKRNEANCRACPKLDAWLDTIPGILSAGISRLAPHTSIQPHFGDTSTIARCHFGLFIPAALPDCGFQVKNEKRSWQEGEWLIFCDAFEHSAWNKTDRARFILIIDVVFPQFLPQQKNIAANVRSLLRLQDTIQKRPWIGKLPGPFRGVLRHFYKFTSR